MRKKCSELVAEVGILYTCHKMIGLTWLINLEPIHYLKKVKGRETKQRRLVYNQCTVSEELFIHRWPMTLFNLWWAFLLINQHFHWLIYYKCTKWTSWKVSMNSMISWTELVIISADNILCHCLWVSENQVLCLFLIIWLFCNSVLYQTAGHSVWRTGQPLLLFLLQSNYVVSLKIYPMVNDLTCWALHESH